MPATRLPGSWEFSGVKVENCFPSYLTRPPWRKAPAENHTLSSPSTPIDLTEFRGRPYCEDLIRVNRVPSYLTRSSVPIQIFPFLSALISQIGALCKMEFVESKTAIP